MALTSWRTSCESRGSRSADPGKSRRKVRPSVRVRVSGMGLVLVGSFLAFRVEALAASAGRPVVRVAHEEAAPRDALGVVHARAIEVFLAVAVHQDLKSVDLDDLVVLVDLPVERETVAGAGAAAARDVHTEIRVFEGAQWLAGLGIGPLDELLDFARCGFGEGDLNHCTTPQSPNTMTPLFKSLVVSCATPSISTRSLEPLPHVAAFRAESEAVVDVARPGVCLGHFELDHSIPAPSGPVTRPLDEELPHPCPASLRRHPDVVNETLRLGRHEPTFPEDEISEELVVCGLGDPPLCSISRHIRFDLLSEMGFPLAAIQSRAFVLRDVVPHGLQGGSPHDVVVRASGPSHMDVHGETRFATRSPAE